MVRYVPDRTGRFSQRPHFEPEELDRECENIIHSFLKKHHGEAKFPVSTDDLTRLIERDSDDLDLYADLTAFGPDVEGVTEFRPGQRPLVKISAFLTSDDHRENRLRTTLTHEYGHVHFHAYLWEVESSQGSLFAQSSNADGQICKRDTILDAGQPDWMEWQAGYVCGALLMPVSHVRRLVGAYRKSHGLFGAISHASKHGRALVAEIQVAFQVSADAARVRLFKLGFFSEADAGSSLFDS